MDEQYLVSQRRAVAMVRELGLSRRAAYYRLTTIPSQMFLDARVYSRVDVDLLRERIRRGLTPAIAE